MSAGPPDNFFATTRWTVVIAAGNVGTPQSEAALEALCKAYWFPLYAYVRRRGYGRQDAQDLTQGFFADLLGRRDIGKVNSERGRFRAFLLSSLKHFVANERDRSQRLKRGGSIIHFTLDWQSADTQFQIADAAARTPDEVYDREWAVALLERVIGQLRDEWVADGKSQKFEQMKEFLTAAKDEITYAVAAANLQMEESALRVAVHRLRKRYRILLRSEVAQTLADPTMVEEELTALLNAFAT